MRESSDTLIMKAVGIMIETTRFVAANVIVGGKVHASGRAMITGSIGEFVPNDRTYLPASIEHAVLKMDGYPPTTIFDVTQRDDVSGWRFRLEL